MGHGSTWTSPPMCVSFHLSRLEYVPIHALQICNLPCDDPFQQAIEQSMPPRTSPPPDPNTLIFGDSKLAKREDHLTPPYEINNAVGALSRKTAFVWRIFMLLDFQTNCLYPDESNMPMGCWSTPTTYLEQWCPLRLAQPCWPVILGKVLSSSLARPLSVLVHMLGSGWAIISVSGTTIGPRLLACLDLCRSIKFQW